MQGGSGAAEWLPYLALLLVVIGWFVANSQANARETRKEARSLIDSAKNRVIEIAADAVAYLCDGKADLAPSIKASLDVLEVELSRLPHFNSKSSPLLRRLMAFQDAVTGGDFETAGRPERNHQSAEVATVWATRTALLAELEKQFRAHYLGGGSSP